MARYVIVVEVDLVELDEGADETLAYAKGVGVVAARAVEGLAEVVELTTHAKYRQRQREQLAGVEWGGK